MGGAAHVLGLAQMIMAANLPVRLRVLIPRRKLRQRAASAQRYHQDAQGIQSSRRHRCEGRLILSMPCSRLAPKTETAGDFATLTGAARVALGPDLPAMFCNDEKLASSCSTAAKKRRIRCGNCRSGSRIKNGWHARSRTHNIGAVLQARSRRRCISKNSSMLPSLGHIDTYAWNPSSKPGRRGRRGVGPPRCLRLIAEFGLINDTTRRHHPYADVHEVRTSKPRGKMETQLVLARYRVETEQGTVQGHACMTISRWLKTFPETLTAARIS